MSPSRRRRTGVALSWVGAAAGSLGWAAACGGEAIIDEGAGAAGGGTSSGDGSPICYTPPPQGSTSACASSGGAFGPGQCQTTLCDEAGNQWLAECDDNSCNCYFNAELRCTCLSEGPLGGCAACCPSPFPQ